MPGTGSRVQNKVGACLCYDFNSLCYEFLKGESFAYGLLLLVAAGQVCKEGALLFCKNINGSRKAKEENLYRLSRPKEKKDDDNCIWVICGCTQSET